MNAVVPDATTAILVIPAVTAAILALTPSYRASARLNVLSSFLTFIAALSLFVRKPETGPYILVDDLNIVFIVLNTFVAFTTSVFSASYIAHELETGRLTPIRLRFYHAMYQILLFAMNLALIANNIGLMWVAVEMATLTTVLMVGVYRTPEAIEAAWKYFILGSVGIALALFGTILVYIAARPTVGEGLDGMVWTVLVTHASAFDPAQLNLAFVFLMLGYGTKVGLAPLHAWLPDAHAEGPTPISAVLSGLLLNVALYAVLRFKLLLDGNPGAIAPGPLMAILGLVSLVFAAFMLYRRRDIKRMFAYSSIEHMGIIAFAFGIGGPLANFAGLLHMIMHSLTKSAIFFTVGHIAQVKGTQTIADIRGLTVSHPLLGWGLVAGVFAIAGLPPLGMFMSEFLVVSSTFARSPLLAIPLVAGLLIAFGALLLRLQGMAFGEPSSRCGARQGVLRADRRSSWVGSDRGDLPAAAAGRLVPACCEPSSLTGGRNMPTLKDALSRAAAMPASRPWPRFIVTPELWRDLARQLADGLWTLSGMWGDVGMVHMALVDAKAGQIAIVSLVCDGGRFPSVAAFHAPAARLERTIQDLFGYESVGAPDQRPWLDHGRWPVRHPLGGRTPASAEVTPYAFLTAEGEGLHQIPVGPVHAGIIEPGHFRFNASGETIVRLEERLGYVHKGVDALMAGASLDRGARVAARTSGDSTVAYSIAFARAVESALNVDVPARASWLRALMAELERLANHFGDIGAICNDAAFALMHAHTGVLRERVLRAAEACFGHRLMMDRVTPGGITADLTPSGGSLLRELAATIRHAFPPLIELYDNTASLQDRMVGTGTLRAELARQFGAGGVIARASGCSFDARRNFAYAPYDQLQFETPTLTEGDVNARVWIRIREVEQSLVLIDQILDGAPSGETRVEVASVHEPREGLALVEGFRGDILAWVRLDANCAIERCHLRDPSWFQWPLLEAVIEGNIVADFPLCNKSFNCSYSGHDL